MKKPVPSQPLAPLTIPLLNKEQGIFHGIFSRHGGYSVAPFTSLNVSLGVGDHPDNVAKNRQRVQSHFNIPTLISARQIHGTQVAVITEPQDSCEIDGFDSLICSVPGIGLMIQQADCQAILLYDPQKKIVAGIHSGWQGSVENIIQETISTMTLTFDTDPAHLLAGISPSLGPCCAEFINFTTELPKAFQKFQVKLQHFDFWAISREQLETAGVHPDNIEIHGTCSKCADHLFSYRRNKKTGRFCSIIGLRYE